MQISKPQSVGAKRFFASFNVQRRVIHALMLREMLTQHGREHLGVFWLVGEPISFTAAIMVLWSLSSHIAQSVNPAAFALTGYTMITLWRHLVPRLMHCARSTAHLMWHRNVHYMDTLISKGFQEMAATGLSFVLIYTPLALIGVLDPVYDPYLLVAGWLLCGWLSFSIALVIAGGTLMVPVLEKFVQPLMYVTLPITGLFFMVSWLPDDYARIVAWSPLVHCFELTRDGMYGHQVEAQWDALFVIKCNVVLTAIGLLLVRKAQTSIRFE